MINIGSIIISELANKETFYLPGLGVFKKEHIPAYFDEEKHLFTPPTETIVIVELELDQDRLTEFITGNSDLSLSKSQTLASSIVSKLENCIARKENTDIEELGSCSVKIDGTVTIQTKPNRSQFSLYDPIEEAELLPIPESITESVAEQSPSTNGDEHEPALSTDESTEPVLDNELNDLEHEAGSKRWLWPVIGVAICVIIAGVWFLRPLQSTTKDVLGLSNQTTGTETTDIKKTESAVDTAGLSTQDSTIEQTPANANAADTLTNTSAEENTNQVVRKPVKRYEIIIAAFETMAEAREFVAKTNAKGYNVYILQNNRAGNMNKISYGSFNTPAEASESLSRVRGELASEAWLWENKNYNTTIKN